MYRDVRDVLSRVQETVPYLGIELQDINQVGMFGDTPLIQVMTWNDVAAAILLLEAGADITARGEDGETALHRAVGAGSAALVELLLANNAPKLAKDDDGYTPLAKAKLFGNEDLVGLLEGETG